MGHKRTSNNADLVKPNQYIIPKHKKAKIPPPKPQLLPKFNPFPINTSYTDGVPNLPLYINLTNTFALFRLIQTDNLLKKLTAYINKYTRLHPY